MIWEKFKDQFHESWHPKMQPFIESEACDKIYQFLKFEGKRGKKIAPASFQTFRAFKETSLQDLKLVILGMCPYHTMKGDQYVADGLCMGCSNTQALQPSLDQFYEALTDDVYGGLALDRMKNYDVSYLAKQGVLMLNAALTTEVNKAGSHLEIWQPFTQYVFEEILAVTGAPVVFLGKDAAKFERYVPPFTWQFKLSHPASASYKDAKWSSEGVFTKVNKILKDNNNFEIEWLEKIQF